MLTYAAYAGAQFAFFTATKVQILTQKALLEASLLAALLERAVARMESFKPQEIGNTT